MNTSAPARSRVIVCVGTYRRNEPLAALLRSVEAAAEHARDRAAVGVVVVDDNPDGAARPVVDGFAGRFELGVHYRHVGRGNISLVRNAAIDAGIELGDWIAMTDDDCEAEPQWLTAMLDVQATYAADCVTGPCPVTVPAGSPAWLTEQPFLDEGGLVGNDGAVMRLAATHNSMISTAWLREHPEHRFEPRLGVVGGEDTVFYGLAYRKGLSIRWAEKAVVRATEGASRTTYRYRLRVAFWLGNTSAVTNLELGSATRTRLVMWGVKAVLRGASRPARRLLARQSPQWRYSLTVVAKGVGQALGAAGVRHRHH
ncbi:MAG: glycosyltransferase family 2 protein [Acidimicrobiales bacterium]|nr:glycosyltransferase family 2 protein [Acidimicrobiales bacterium]MCB9392326.1 glycosyltransferase family 2 protein [Acidimicrobiaceae bacterium]